MNRITTLMSAVAVTSVVAFMGVPAAFGAPVPGTLAEGNEMFVFEYDNNLTEDLVSVDVATGLTTTVGTSAFGDGWSGASFNPADGQIYALHLHGWTDPYTLYSIDPVTGVFTEIGDLPDGVSAGALAIDADGNGYLIDWDERLYSIDLTDATTTLIGSFTMSGGDVYAFAINPVDGRAFFLEFYGGKDLYEIDLTDASTTLVVDGYHLTVGTDSAVLAFDSNGTAWLQVERNTAELWSADIDNFAATAQYETQFFNPDDQSDPFYTEAFAIVYPTDGGSANEQGGLAATGLEDANLWTGAALGTFLVAAGAVVIARRVRR